MSEVFSRHDLDFGCTNQVKHQITLHDETPFEQRARPIHPQDNEAVRRHLCELLDAGVIRESTSPFSSPIVVIRKKNGDIRLCIDYRKLNLLTIKDAYALPNLEETFTALTGSRWFPVLDLKSGYYQIAMKYGLKLALDFQTSVRYLGHIVSESGVETDPDKISTLKSWPTPKNLKQLRSFLVFTGCYHRFIKDYAVIAKPFNDLTQGYSPGQKTKTQASTKSHYSSNQPFGQRWSQDCQKAFETFIEKLSSARSLGLLIPLFLTFHIQMQVRLVSALHCIRSRVGSCR